MKTHLLSITAALLLATALPAADPAADRDAFNRLKSLVGEWEATTKSGKARLTYELTAAGTALVERETAEKRPAMFTVYHLDGDRLLLTHYCIAGNQPRMQARPFNAESGELEFRFLDATSLKTPAAGHMRNVKFRFIDKNRFESAWEFYEGGKSKFTETAEYTRVR